MYATKDLGARDSSVGPLLDRQRDAHGGGPYYTSSVKACIVIPAYDAEATIGAVIDAVREAMPDLPLYVVDDGSRDGTATIAKDRRCTVLAHERNRGKGAALRTAFAAARDDGHDVALTIDADGQHPAGEARRVLEASNDAEALVLGVRALERDGAPKKNVFSNGISNYFLSRFAGRPLRDTQCGLRRYPLARTLDLAARAHGTGYELEAELLLRAVWAGVPIVEVPVTVLYPEDRTTHFRISRDPWRIIDVIVRARLEHARGRA